MRESISLLCGGNAMARTMDRMPRPRNVHAPTVTLNLAAKTYDEFVQAKGDRPVTVAIDKLVRMFNAMPKDVREAWLSDLSPQSKARVLRAILRSMPK